MTDEDEIKRLRNALDTIAGWCDEANLDDPGDMETLIETIGNYARMSVNG